MTRFLPWSGPVATLAIAAVRLYQYTLRGVIGSNCRFHPSCSDYAVEALANHGALRGGALAAWRILRCNPWSAAGEDPVPATSKRAAADSCRMEP